MKKVIVFIPLLLFLLGCTNPYSQYYQDYTGGKNILNEPGVVVPTGEPKLRRGGSTANADNDAKVMLENGYLLIGVSSFNAGGDVTENGALEQAKRIHADTVFVYSHYTNTVSGVAPLTVPNIQTGTAYHSGTIYGSGGGFANYSGSSQITTYGTRTTYVPYQIARYDYFATYWVKIRPILGVHFEDLTDELRRKTESNKGVHVVVVVKGSPAFNNDILTGDIIRKINDIEVVDMVHAQKTIFENKGKEIKLEIFRDGKTITKQIQLN